MKTHWSDERLTNLFDHYNRLYWRRKLPAYRIVRASLPGRLGLCESAKKLITIDPDQHENDRGVRGTVLHEMVHAATQSGHDVKFFAQLERLLRRGALATIETGDAGGIRFYGEVVPRRFPLLRKKMQRLEARRADPIKRLLAEKKISAETITGDMIVEDFRKPDVMALPWKRALLCIGLEYGLTDESGRPVNARARSIVRKGKKVHSRARRDHLEYEKLWRNNPSASAGE